MALTIRRLPDNMIFGLVTAHNATRRAITENLTTHPHCDCTSTPSGDYRVPAASALVISVADASDLDTGIALAVQAKKFVNIHFLDDVAHKAADSANVIATATPTTQGELDTALNELKADLNLHFAQVGVHFTNDGTNTIVAANSSNLGTSITLANAIKVAFNAHIQAALGGQSLDVVGA